MRRLNEMLHTVKGVSLFAAGDNNQKFECGLKSARGSWMFRYNKHCITVID